MKYPLIGLVTEPRYTDRETNNPTPYIQNIFLEDSLLSAALQKHGVQTKRVSWSDPSVDWSEFQEIVIRTTWDYYDRFAEFSRWLDQVEKATGILNRPELLRWNLDKHYLADLESEGVAIVPTHYLEQGTKPDVAAILDSMNGQEAVLKPCVSGGARDTYRLSMQELDTWQSLIDRLLPHKAMMVQPFQNRILDQGEITLVVMDGRVTHSVRKVAKAGDFRVQDDHGGTVHAYQATQEEIAFAEKAMAACNPQPVYGRVDIVRGEEGQLQIMEVELVEPELWMRFHPASAEPFAEGIARHLPIPR